MDQIVLVTYATRTGSTAGVAAVIGQALSANGVDVALLPMPDVTEVTPYQAVVAGSAIQNKQWLPEAMGFLQAHQAALRQKPVAIFAVCMTLAMPDGEKYRPRIAEWLAPVRALVPTVSEGLFAGVLDIDKIPSFADRLKFRLSVASGVWSEGDHRNWHAIHAWAAALPTPLLGTG